MISMLMYIIDDHRLRETNLLVMVIGYVKFKDKL